MVFAKRPAEMTDVEVYGAIIELQSSLIEKKEQAKRLLERNGNYGLEHAAICNEIETLKSTIKPIKLFYSSAVE